MKIDKLIRKRMMVFVTTLSIVAILTISSTYALGNNDINKTGVEESRSKLRLKYDNTLKTGSYPMNKETGLKKSPVNDVEIINKSSASTDYSLMLFPTDMSDKSITVDKIYYSINGDEPIILGDTKDYIVYHGKINGNSKEKVTIQMWVDLEKVENTDQGRTLNLDFKVLNY